MTSSKFFWHLQDLKDVKWVLDESVAAEPGKVPRPKRSGTKSTPAKTEAELEAEKEQDDKMRRQRATKTQVDRIKQRYASMKKPAAVVQRPAKRVRPQLHTTPQASKMPRLSVTITNKRAL